MCVRAERRGEQHKRWCTQFVGEKRSRRFRRRPAAVRGRAALKPQGLAAWLVNVEPLFGLCASVLSATAPIDVTTERDLGGPAKT